MAKYLPRKVDAGTSIDEGFAKYVKECRRRYKKHISTRHGSKTKIQDSKSGYLVPPFKPNLKVLLVFSTVDLTCDALRRASEKVGFEVTQCSSADSAFDEFQSKLHDLILIDTRSTKCFDYETLCRAIRGYKNSQHAPIVAVVKKSLFERDTGGVSTLLGYGFNRCLVESSSVTNYINEIHQLKINDMKSMAQKATAQALYVALDKCNNLVFITDDNYKCQYANVLIEKYLNIHQEEIVGKNFAENIVYDQSQLTSISSSLLRGREWRGPLILKNKLQNVVLSECNAMPIACYGRLPTHFVFNLDVSNAPAGPVNENVRRTSEFRRASLTKLMSYPLEAPIIKITALLDQVRMGLIPNSELVYLLDKAEDLLRNSELYSTNLKDNYRIKPEEPIVSDLITALLSNEHQRAMPLTTRRASNDSTTFRASKVKRLPTEVDDVLLTALHWDFEIFRLEELTKSRPLLNLGMHLVQHYDILGALSCDEITLRNWFIIIESHYHSRNCYHNSTHAADVMQATAGFLQSKRVKAIMEPIDEAMCLLAAAAHDVDHPGKSSAFLANSDNTLAILYNDISILENHHVACMFKLTIGDERVNVFKNLERDTYKIVRHNIIDMILATEMTKHFEHLTKFVNVFCSNTEDEEGDSLGSLILSKGSNKSDGKEKGSSEFITLSLPENVTLIKRMLIKCADVSNPTRPFRIYMEWARRIAEEYFQQTDEEKLKGLPVVMPMFDRKTCSIPKSQIGFVDYIVNDMFEAWNAFIEMPELINYLRQNYMRWKEFDDQGHRTLSEITLLQSSEVQLAPVLPSIPKLPVH